MSDTILPDGTFLVNGNPIRQTSDPSRAEVDIFQIGPDSRQWPCLWRHMADPPREITISGQADVLNTPILAMVGTRRATNRGLAVAHELAAQLAAMGWTIASGLALGIDAAAHQGALSTGRSIGVMATGIDRTYPYVHRRLRARIEQAGCCLTEFDLGASPRRFHFPRRNRLIAALAQAVIVVEAPLKSGAMVTAYQALDYNRDVFAVPGPVDLETSRGCHHLLRQGAYLLESPADVERVLERPDPSQFTNVKSADAGHLPLPVAGSGARWIFDRLDLEGKSRDDLHQQWPGNEQAWIEGVLALELAGLIRRLPGGRLALSIWRSPDP